MCLTGHGVIHKSEANISCHTIIHQSVRPSKDEADGVPLLSPIALSKTKLSSARQLLDVLNPSSSSMLSQQADAAL